ncbi:hypothetical protein GCM10020218_059650 [Dactylosporangium vinaceum]
MRRVLLVTQAAHAVLSAGFAAVVLFGGHLSWLYLLAFLTGLVSAADGPALGRFGGMVCRPGAAQPGSRERLAGSARPAGSSG